MTTHIPTIKELERMAATIRCDVIHMIHCARAGHPGGSLSAADIVTALYFRVMRLDPQNPAWPERDRFILSKGHGCPVWYAALAPPGLIGKAELATLRRHDSRKQGHPDMLKTPGLDMTAGSLGHGLSAGLGMALGGRVKGLRFHVYVVLGDGETQEGEVWEAALAAAKWQVSNLVAILDRNHLQNDGETDQIMPIEPVADKWRAFGWDVREIDGHDMGQIVEALEDVRDHAARPTLVLAHTVKGRGVSFMENVAGWHGRAPTDEEAEQALCELRRCLDE